MPELKHYSILQRRYFRTLYVFVLHTENPTTFISNVVVTPCDIEIIYIQISQNPWGYVFLYVKTFSHLTFPALLVLRCSSKKGNHGGEEVLTKSFIY